MLRYGTITAAVNIFGMKKKPVEDIVYGFYKTLGHFSREMALDFNEDAVHNFRVEYKKMRAFFRLVNDGSGKIVLKVPKKLKEVYALAGMYRDRQLQQVRLLEAAKSISTSFREYSDALSQEMNEIRAGLLQLLAAKPLDNRKKRVAGSLHSSIKLQVFSHTLQRSTAMAREILSQPPIPDRKLHQVRKVLKDLFYNLEIYRQADKFPIGTWKEKVAEYFNPLLAEMGEYQDKCTAIELLESYWLQHLDSEIAKPLLQLMDEWNNQKTAMKIRLVEKLKADHVLATGEPADIPLILETVL
jgi:CHAD domain-containing protein